MRGGNAGRSGEWGACEWLGWDASSPAVQRIKAPSLALKYAKADADGVTVRRVKLGPRVRSVVISNSYGGQIGRHNRQLNDFRYRIVQPRVSVAAMLAANPALQRALARLVANPDSAIANYAFRQRLSAPVGPTGGVRFTGMPSPSGARVSVHLDDRGEVVVDRARGLQIGNWNTQRNQFAYQVSRPELGLGSVLRDRPDLARLLAMAVKYPGNGAVRRSFTSQLADSYGRSSSLVRHLRGGHRSGVLGVRDVAGFQLGSAASRVDKASLHVDRLVLTGWAGPAVKKIQRAVPPRAARVDGTRGRLTPRPGPIPRAYPPRAAPADDRTDLSRRVTRAAPPSRAHRNGPASGPGISGR
jgi:hypothetical protein